MGEDVRDQIYRILHLKIEQVYKEIDSLIEKLSREQEYPKEKIVREAYDLIGEVLLKRLALYYLNDDSSFKTPGWMRKIEKEYTRKNGYYMVFSWILHNVYGIHVDHVYYSRDGRFVSEPYHMGKEDFEKLIDFCNRHGLDFYVTGFSHYFPGETLRLEIYPKKEKEG